MLRRDKGVILVPLIDRLFGRSLFSLERDEGRGRFPPVPRQR